MTIPLTPVSSSQIAAVGYDAASHVLVIRFHGSSREPAPVYSYDGVPPELAIGLIVAESPGSYFHHHIRQGRYSYRRHVGVPATKPLGREAR